MPQSKAEQAEASGRERQPTMVDVARLADVSTAAVSYYLSGREEQLKRISPDVQNRIQHAVKRLGYVPNKTARHLRLQRTERICVLLPQLGIPFADRLRQDIEAAARRRGFLSIVVTGEDSASIRRVVSEVEAGLADGLVAEVNSLAGDELEELLAPLRRASKPSLILHPTAAATSFSVVNHDRLGALRGALEHLLANGHTSLAYVRNTAGQSDPRSAAVLDFIAEHAGRIARPLMLDGGDARATGIARAKELAQLLHPPTAVLVESDFTAVSMIQEFQRLGLRVPEDMAVIGCGNAEEGRYSHPRLTTMGPEWLSLSDATDHLIDQIEDRSLAPRSFSIRWRLYLRESG